MYLEPVSKIISNLRLDPGDPNGVQAYFTSRCKAYMDKYTPGGEDGNLANLVALNTESIVYMSPYAHYMYEGRVMGPNIPIFQKGVKDPVGFYSPVKPKYYTGQDIHYKTPGTGDHWDKRMVSAEMDAVIRDVQDYIDRGGK